MHLADQFSIANPPTALVMKVLERALSIPRIREVYLKARADVEAGREAYFWDAMLKQAGLKVDFNREGLEAVPAHGPVVMVANHPFGVLDGLAFLHIAAQARPDGDIKIVINDLQRHIPDIGEYALPVNNRKKKARGENFSSRQSAEEHLKNGGCLLIFPAGTVSGSRSVFSVKDPAWKNTAACLAQKTGAALVPVGFPGRNGWLFQLAAHFHEMSKIGLMARDTAIRFANPSPVRAKIGKPIETKGKKIAMITREARSAVDQLTAEMT